MIGHKLCVENWVGHSVTGLRYTVTSEYDATYRMFPVDLRKPASYQKLHKRVCYKWLRWFRPAVTVSVVEERRVRVVLRSGTYGLLFDPQWPFFLTGLAFASRSAWQTQSLGATGPSAALACPSSSGSSSSGYVQGVINDTLQLWTVTMLHCSCVQLLMLCHDVQLFMKKIVCIKVKCKIQSFKKLLKSEYKKEIQ